MFAVFFFEKKRYGPLGSHLLPAGSPAALLAKRAAANAPAGRTLLPLPGVERPLAWSVQRHLVFSLFLFLSLFLSSSLSFSLSFFLSLYLSLSLSLYLSIYLSIHLYLSLPLSL